MVAPDSIAADFSWRAGSDLGVAVLHTADAACGETVRFVFEGTRLDRLADRLPYPDQAHELRQLLDRRAPFRHLRLAALDRTQRAVHFTLSAQPRQAPDGRFLGYEGSGQLWTERPFDDQQRREMSLLLERADRGRERERRLRLETEALLAGLAVLIKPYSIKEKWLDLFRIFAGVIAFNEAGLVRRGSGGKLRISSAWPVSLEGTVWPESKAMGAALAGEGSYLDPRSADGAVVPPEMAAETMSVLLTPVQVGKASAVLVLCSKEPNAFGDRELELLRRLGLVIAQASHAEEQNIALLSASRLAGLGELMATIAHEINSPLSAISMAAENSLHLIAKGDTARLPDKLQKIGRQAQRAGDIIHSVRMLAYPDRAPGTMQSVRLAEIARNVEVLIGKSLANRSVQLEIEIAPTVRSVLANPVNLSQVVLNLVANARDAIAGKNEGIDRPPPGVIRVAAFDVPDRDHVRLIVSDNGGGIPADVIDRIFDPFFTLKSAGEGTGLGLAIVRSMLADMQADVEVRSDEVGATFEITLRAHEAA